MNSSPPFIPLRFSAIICSVLLLLNLSGCATRALMSSDRYEKPEPETQQFRSGDDISRSWQPSGLIQTRSYFAANKTDQTVKSNM